MKARLLWDKILRAGIKLCMLTGVAFTFAACYGTPPEEPYMEFEASGEIFNQENEPLENIEVSIKYWGTSAMNGFSDENGQYLLKAICFPSLDSIDIVARDTTGVYEPDSARVKLDFDPNTRRDRWSEGTLIAQQDFQLKKIEQSVYIYYVYIQ